MIVCLLASSTLRVLNYFNRIFVNQFLLTKIKHSKFGSDTTFPCSLWRCFWWALWALLCCALPLPTPRKPSLLRLGPSLSLRPSWDSRWLQWSPLQVCVCSNYVLHCIPEIFHLYNVSDKSLPRISIGVL